MSLLAAVLLGLAALLLHVALMLLVAPLVPTLIDAVSKGHRLDGSWQAMLSQPFLDLRDLMGKESIRADNASLLAVVAPRLSLGLALAASLLVPSFAIELTTAPAGDLVLVLALLGTGQAVLMLGAVDEGLAAPGLAAVSQAVGMLVSVPGTVLSVCVLALSAGGTGLDLILSAERSVAWLPTPTSLAAGLALALVPLASAGPRVALSQHLSGPDLAMFRAQDSLVVLVWIDLIGALILPGTLALAQSSPSQWLLGLLLWSIKVALACLLIGAMRSWLGTPVARRRLAGLSALLALLAPMLSMVTRA